MRRPPPPPPPVGPPAVFGANAVLFDIDENQDSITQTSRGLGPRPPPPQLGLVQPRQVHVRPTTRGRGATDPSGGGMLGPITDDDPVLGERRGHRAATDPGGMGGLPGVLDHQQLQQQLQRQQLQFQEQWQRRRRARSRRQSTSPWPSCCGLHLPVVTLRLLTSLVLVPGLVAGLVWLPAMTVVWVLVVVACVGLYEYAWLAFRIHYQLLTTFNWYERSDVDDGGALLGANAAMTGGLLGAPDDDDVPSGAEPFQSFVSTSVSQSTASMQMDDDFDDDGASIGGPMGGYHDQGFGTNTYEAATAASRLCHAVASPLDMLELAGASSAVSGFAIKWCGGREWLATILLGIVVVVPWTLVLHLFLLAPWVPVVDTLPEAVVRGLPWLTWLGNGLACICALSTPNARSAVAVLAQLQVFFAIVLNSLACPVATPVEVCDPSLLSATELTAIGALQVLFVRGLTTTSPADMVVAVTLDLLGFVYVIGTSVVLVGLVDARPRRAGTAASSSALYPRVILLLLLVLWCAQSAAYGCNALMRHFQLLRRRILPKRLAVRLDLEATVTGLCVGVLAVAAGTAVIPLPTPLWLNALYALATVTLAELGGLFHGLLRRAAGVRRASRLLPGFGGVLDVASPALFASVAIAKLYLAALQYERRDIVVAGAANKPQQPQQHFDFGSI